jgi:protocatechuate 3,4-dioxygenase beta subunit
VRGQPSRGVASSPREDLQPPYLYPDYVATRLRAPQKPLIILPQTLSDLTGPSYGRGSIGELDNDLTRQHGGEPLGERIVVTGRVLDGDGRAVRRSLIEIWQANAAGRYTHQSDQHPAPLDLNFSGAGRCLTDGEGCYSFATVTPGHTRGRTTTTLGGRPTYSSRSSGRPSGAGSSPRSTSPATRSSIRTRSSSRCAIRRPRSV